MPMVKGHHRIWNMNVRNSSTDVPNVNKKKINGPDTKTSQGPHKFDLKVKVQGHIRIMNVRDISSKCAKYGKPMSNQKKVMGRTRICTDRRTDRVIPIYPLELSSRGRGV